jgi:hypothetical protein
MVEVLIVDFAVDNWRGAGAVAYLRAVSQE